ncbi:uncharacterized protein Z518_07909 [Rhinocladiella mackenziei CBS 650.93]|uniref:Rhinocladiella mackenziei CBS 650.93 unplaced genomic scaffold supercont1.6, whole genome shotgun sequence n=1 Tax=Rhinocladiella mackenziei CBS 650.93 TaxID=1442369 RepID=A0A0D2IZC0_9EURO|nr:uncharacterized protein Z518_07909 [Rhinocladiella mackenziei CBS 650.93]KIX01970.1 hypothetical protein Z518_07909 [Rhinocladiella mackenziei CBS 650.93]
MADLVCCALEALSRTGLKDGVFKAAFLHNDEELTIELDQRRNDWSKILRDSDKTAVYAVVNERCIECHTPTHVMAECDDTLGFTALNTSVDIPNGGTPQRIVVNGENLKIHGIPEGGGNVLIVSPTSGFTISRPTEATESRDLALRSSGRYLVFTCATTKGFNGMEQKRARNRVRQSRDAQNRAIRVLSEAREARITMGEQRGERTTELLEVYRRPTSIRLGGGSRRASSMASPSVDTAPSTSRMELHNPAVISIPRREIRNGNSTVRYEAPVRAESGNLIPHGTSMNQLGDS